MPPGTATEFRIPRGMFVKGNYIGAAQRFSQTLAGYYDSPHSLMVDAGRLRGVSGYVVLNPVNSALLARSYNTLVKATHTTKDDDITCLRWIVVDIDPVRPADISSTNDELAAAVGRRDAILADLPELAASAIYGRSGNGAYIFVRLPDLPNDAEHRQHVADALAVLSHRFSDDAVKVDVTTKNPARIGCLPGTIKAKGSSMSDRPWRLATLDSPAPAGGQPQAFDLPRFVATNADTLALIAELARQKSASRGRSPASSVAPGSPAALLDGLEAKAEIIHRAARYLDSMAPAVSGQGGHNQLFDATCALVKGFGLAPSEARPILEMWNQRCIPPWSSAELEHKLTDALDRPGPDGYLLDAPRHNAPARMAEPFGLATDESPAGPTSAGQATERKSKREIPEESFCNADPGDGDQPVELAFIVEHLHLIAKGPWPRRVGDRLFVQGPGHDPIYLDKAARLFAWIAALAPIYWPKGPNLITQEWFFEHLSMTARNYDAIETLPHWPPIARIFYMHPEPPAPSAKLNRLLSFFRPASDEDRELLLAFLLTLFWGGPAGTRPAFLITGPDDDPQQGRGLGKTKVVEVYSELAGGYVDVSPTDAITDVKTRLLSDEARQKRIARLDNVKTHKLSWADLEGLITSSEISGRMLYRGEGRRPNTITWAITLNGASLSKDMSQRVIVIKLNRPTFNATWEHEVFSFVRTHRWDILADIGQILEDDVEPITPATRWAVWEQGVLARTSLPADCQRVIKERQASVDEDDNERELVAEHFAAKLRDSQHAPDSACVVLPSETVAAWLSEVTRKHYATNHASAYLKGLDIPELKRAKVKHSRVWIWRGSNARAGQEPIDLGDSF